MRARSAVTGRVEYQDSGLVEVPAGLTFFAQQPKALAQLEAARPLDRETREGVSNLEPRISSPKDCAGTRRTPNRVLGQN